MAATTTTPFAQNFRRWFLISLLAFAVAVFIGGSAIADHSNGHQGTSGGNSSPAIEAQIFSFDEEQNAGTSVGQIIATTNRKGGLLAYEIIDGNASGLFALASSTGELTATAPLNFEVESVYLLIVRVTDVSGKTDTGEITVSVLDVNEEPTASDASFNVSEQLPIGAIVGTVSASDPDTAAPFNTLSYAITAGNVDGAFEIDPATGELSISAALNFDETTLYSLDVTVTDLGGLPDGLSHTASVTINVAEAVIPANVADIDGTNGFALIGEGAGTWLAMLGDMNGDGIDDFAISASGADVNGSQSAGSVYVVYGNSDASPLNST